MGILHQLMIPAPEDVSVWNHRMAQATGRGLTVDEADMQVFVSYKRQDRVQVEHLVSVLHSLELTTWYDVKLAAGEQWQARIDHRARSCQAMVVLWSAGAAKSKWVAYETEIGLERGVLVPARLDHHPIPDRWSQIHCADLSNWSGEMDHAGLHQVVAGLEHPLDLSLRANLDELIGATNPNAVLALRHLLVGVARSGEKPLTYGETEAALASELNLTRPITGRSLWGTLDAMAQQNRLRREPPLPALVVSEGTGIPGRGYFQKHCFIDDHATDVARSLHAQHVARVRAYDWPDDIVG